MTGRPGDLTGEIDERSQRVVPAIQPWRDGFALAWNEYAPASVEIHDGTSEVFFLSVR